ncbi:hypothetical protein TSAR_002694, partial [Trichomalopsis sarcophagae]
MDNADDFYFMLPSNISLHASVPRNKTDRRLAHGSNQNPLTTLLNLAVIPAKTAISTTIFLVEYTK